MSSVLKSQSGISQVAGETGVHSYTEEETVAFADFINSKLSKDEDLAHLMPLKEPKDLFTSVSDGILMCKLLNVSIPGTVDPRVINVKKNLNPWQRNENHTLAINSAKAIGVSTVNIGPVDLNEGRAHIILGLVWQVIKAGLLKDINLKSHKELVLLLNEGEEMSDFLNLPPEEVLIRWVNYHLAKAGSQRRIENFSGDIKDSEVYTLLLKQVAPFKECTTEPLNEEDLTERAEKMLQEADKIECRQFVSARDVVKGNPKLNLAFVANIFNTHHGLVIEEGAYDFAELLNFDEEGSREERAFRFWIQSLGIDVKNLFEDSKDGILLLKVQEKVEAGIVDWKKVNMRPRMKIHQVANCNYVVELAKQMKLSVVNIGGLDIQNGDKKLILAIVWQLMKQNLLNILTEVGGGKKISEDDCIEWANKKVTGSGKINNFKDSTLKTGIFLCRLAYMVAPKSCNPEFITPGSTDEECEQNAKYVISVARKIGCSVFLLWEDIVEVNSKMIFTLVASLKKAEVDLKKVQVDEPEAAQE